MSNNLLKGKRGIIFGALNDMSIAWKVAERAVEEGATITLSNTPVAVRMGQVSELSEKLHAEVIPAAKNALTTTSITVSSTKHSTSRPSRSIKCYKLPRNSMPSTNTVR